MTHSHAGSAYLRMMRIAVISGASGLTGKELLYRLLESTAYSKVISVGRRKVMVKHDKLEQVVHDPANSEVLQFNELVSDAFCCVGTTIAKARSRVNFRKVDHHYVVDFARAAKAAGAERFFVVSAQGANPDSAIFYNKVKGEMEHGVASIGFRATHIFRPGLLMGDRHEFRPLEKIAQVVMKLLKPLLAGPLRKFRGIDVSELASQMIVMSEGNDTGVWVHELAGGWIHSWQGGFGSIKPPRQE